MINVFQPSLGSEELEAVRKVFESNWIGKGKVTDEFELAFARHLNVRPDSIRSISCGTEGLFQAMTLLGLGRGDEVILSSIGFVGAANAVASCGAHMAFADVDPSTLNMTAECIESKMTPRTRAVILLHYGGVPSEMDGICGLLEGKNIALIEDSACSVASRYRNRACGTFGDIGIWSFDAMKILVTGDGGMLYCRDLALARRAEELTYLGLESKSGLSRAVDARWWEFDVRSHGRRAIMNDMASAIGLEQLKKLPDFVARRRQVHEFFDAALAGLDWLQVPPPIPAHAESSYYFYWIRTDPVVRDDLAGYLRARGVYTTFRYYPLHWVRFFEANCQLPNTETVAQTTLCLPIHQSLSRDDQVAIVELIREFGRQR